MFWKNKSLIVPIVGFLLFAVSMTTLLMTSADSPFFIRVGSLFVMVVSGSMIMAKIAAVLLDFLVAGKEHRITALWDLMGLTAHMGVRQQIAHTH